MLEPRASGTRYLLNDLLCIVSELSSVVQVLMECVDNSYIRITLKYGHIIVVKSFVKFCCQLFFACPEKLRSIVALVLKQDKQLDFE